MYIYLYPRDLTFKIALQMRLRASHSRHPYTNASRKVGIINPQVDNSGRVVDLRKRTQNYITNACIDHNTKVLTKVLADEK